MNQILLELFENTGDILLQDIVLRLVMATVIAVFIFISYALSYIRRLRHYGR